MPAAQDSPALEGFEGWRFDSCELRPQRHELKVNGKVRPLPQKALELLLLLIRERHRVISHNELVARLWPASSSSGRVLPATIAKLRAAIDSDRRQWGHETSAIRTVHRTGYRFVAPLQAIEPEPPYALVPQWSSSSQQLPALQTPPSHPTAPGPAARVAMAAALGQPLRLGLLHGRNSTSLAARDWTEDGLMALVAHALARDPRLLLVETESLVKWPAWDGTEARAEAAIEGMMRDLGLHVLVRCSLRPQGDSHALTYVLLTSAGALPGGDTATDIHSDAQALPAASPSAPFILDAVTLPGTPGTPMPQALARQLAQAIEGELFGDQAQVMRLESDDEFVNLAFARAVSLFAKGDYAGAAEVMAVVCHLQPDSLAAEGWRLRAWARGNDPRAAQTFDDWRARARDAGDAYTLALVEPTMGGRAPK